jgi:hypothetical protein
MSAIPIEWLVRRTSLEEELRLCDESKVGTEEDKREEKKYYTDVVTRLMAQMRADDELWWYSNPRPTGTSGFAIVRNGEVVGLHTVLIT